MYCPSLHSSAAPTPPPNKISFSSKKEPGDHYVSQARLKLTVFPNTHASDSGNSRVRHQVGQDYLKQAYLFLIFKIIDIYT